MTAEQSVERRLSKTPDRSELLHDLMLDRQWQAAGAKFGCALLLCLPQFNLLRAPPVLRFPIAGGLPQWVWALALMVVAVLQIRAALSNNREKQIGASCLGAGVWAALSIAVFITLRPSFALCFCPLAALADYRLPHYLRRYV